MTRTEMQLRGMLCPCPENDRPNVEIVGEIKHAWLRGGGNQHTEFMLLRCTECGFFLGFPVENLTLFVTQGREDVQQAVFNLMKQVLLQKAGLTLEDVHAE